MEKSKLFRHVYAVFAAVAAALLLASPNRADSSKAPKSTPAPLYVIKAELDRIGIYASTSDSALYYLDTPLSALPAYDRDLLYDGIAVYSKEELNERIQDFDS